MGWCEDVSIFHSYIRFLTFITIIIIIIIIIIIPSAYYNLFT
jgi:uncharacterized membrane protein